MKIPATPRRGSFVTDDAEANVWEVGHVSLAAIQVWCVYGPRKGQSESWDPSRVLRSVSPGRLESLMVAR